MPNPRRPILIASLVVRTASVNEPLAMLHACHDRMRVSRQSLQRICDDLAQGRALDEVQGRAAEVLSYFDEEALQHHEDEEQHIFPCVLQTTGDPAVRACVLRLQEDHLAMEAHWARLRTPLVALAAGHADTFGADQIEEARHFLELYVQHALTEETVVFPAAALLLDEAALHAMGAEMSVRRGAGPSSG
jgi:hemerythrin-like domain-containing protein